MGESLLFRILLHPDASLKKMGMPVSREDPYHVHKTLGLLSLASFVYRYGVVYPKTGTLGFDGTPFDWASMGLHLALAFSSIIFHVPKNRLPTKPMVIYEEYRQHAMVFTARCFSVFAVSQLYTGPYRGAVIPFVVMLHHMTADAITAKHGNGSTAVRANSDKFETGSFYKKVAVLYSAYQFLAVASHVLPNERIGDLAFNAIVAIASSAFLMTLYKKRVIRGMAHLVGYSACLLLSSFHIVRCIGWYSSAMAMVAFAIRINLPKQWSNKYVIWTAFVIAMTKPWDDPENFAQILNFREVLTTSGLSIASMGL